METAIVELMEAQGGAASSAELTALPGVTRHTVDALVRAKVLERVRRGAFVLGSVAASAAPWERAQLRARAVGHSLAADPDGHHALSHESALMLHGLPYFGADGLVHLARFDGGRGRHDDTIFVHRPVAPDRVVIVDKFYVVRPALAALQVTALHGAEAGLVCLDGVLHQAETRPQVHRQSAGTGPCPGRRGHRTGASGGLRHRHPDGPRGGGPGRRSQRVGRGEPITMAAAAAGVRPAPAAVPRRSRRPHGVCRPKLGRWAVLIEFDGKVKYGDPQALHAEKVREDALRGLGDQVVRLTWDDLANPRLVRHKILAAIARAKPAARVTA